MSTVQGIIHVTGGHDVGKTTFALECGASPDKIIFFDDDVKGSAAVKDLERAGSPIGRYVDLQALSKGKLEVEFHKAVLEEIKRIKPGQFDALIWDTWTGFANTCHPYVVKNPSLFRETWSPNGQIKGGQQWQSARHYEAKLLGELLNLVPTVILVTHLKDYRINNVVVPEKQIPASSDVLAQLPRLRLWLMQNPAGRAVPMALVLKRMDEKRFVPGAGLRTVNILPRRLVPIDGEFSLWDTIARYQANPVGDRLPTPEETPDAFEMSILDGTLTGDQRRSLQGLITSGIADRDEANEIRAAIDGSNVKEMAAKGMSPIEIARTLKLDLPLVLAELDGEKEF